LTEKQVAGQFLRQEMNMTPKTNRLTLAALTLLVGCGQDLDLGTSRANARTIQLAPPPRSSSTSAAGGCAFEDPALLKAPEACSDPTGDKLFRAACVVTAEGPVRPVGDALLTVPACPTGVYVSLSGGLPPVENIERALLVFKGVDYDKRAFAADTGTPLPRTVEVFPDRGSFFVRLDPRPSVALRINVLARCAELFAGSKANPCGDNYGFTVGFLAGTRAIP
jgi:hypothetical protein